MFYKGKFHSRFHGRERQRMERRREGGGGGGAEEGFPNFSRLPKLRFLAPALLSRYYLSKYCHAGDTIPIGAELKTKSCLPVFNPTILMLLFCSKIYYFSFFSSPKRSLFT